jgi:small subunit ribosomal protein S16
MVKIRLRRVGSKKQTSFRVVVADSRSPRDGRFIEEIGFYNPRTEPETLRIDEERALHWLSVGAQPTDSAARLLRSTGTMDRFERLKQGESLDDLLTEAEAPDEEEAEEAPAAAVPEEEEGDEEATEPEAEEAAGVEEAETEEPPSEEEPEEEEPEAEEPEADVEEGESDQGADEAEEEDESEE